jgi:membrane-associated phospholipid phosphatase
MIKNFNAIKFYFLVYLLFVILASISMFYINKGDEVILLNKLQTPFFDVFFKVFNILGEWFLIMIIGVYLLLKHRFQLYFFLIGFLGQMLTVRLLKKYFNFPRPLSYFKNYDFQMPENIPLLYHQSFPSGHTTTAFFILTTIALFLNPKKRYMLILILSAILVGVARIYLLAHFKEDVLVGSLIGVFWATFSMYLFLHFLNKKNNVTT